ARDAGERAIGTTSRAAPDENRRSRADVRCSAPRAVLNQLWDRARRSASRAAYRGANRPGISVIQPEVDLVQDIDRTLHAGPHRLQIGLRTSRLPFSFEQPRIDRERADWLPDGIDETPNLLGLVGGHGPVKYATPIADEAVFRLRFRAARHVGVMDTPPPRGRASPIGRLEGVSSQCCSRTC